MIYVLLGSSGSGKTTLGRKTFGKQKELISTTSRAIRKGEFESEDYYFVTKEEFEKRIEQNEMFEHTRYLGNYYGLSKKEVSNKADSEEVYFAVLTIEGYKKLKEQFGDKVVGIYIQTKRSILKNRLIDRGDNPDEVEKRMALHALENKKYHKVVDYMITNDNSLKKAKQQLYRIILKESEKKK